MRKEQATAALGGSIASAARQIGVTYRAYHKAPDPLPPRIADRVLAAIARRELPVERLRQLGLDVHSQAADEAAER